MGFFALYLLSVGLYFLIKLRFTSNIRCLRCKDKLEKKLFYSSLLDLIEASYIILTIAILIGIQYMSFESPTSIIRSILVLVFGCQTIFVPAITGAYLLWDGDRIQDG